MAEQEIIRQILQGNSALYNQLIRQYGKLCFSVAYRVVGDSDNAQDVVQEAMISAYENLNQFKSDAKFSTWLYRIVMNKALAYKQKQKFFDEVDNQEYKDTEYDEELELTQSAQVKTALSVLNEKERLVIDLFYYQEQSIRDISQICQLTEPNTKVILHRARKKMNEVLSNQPKFAIQ